MDILITTNRPEAFTTFQAALAVAGFTTHLASTGEAALARIKSLPPTLCIVDATLPDMGPFALVAQLATVNALVNTAVVSELSDEQFHDAGEGLGIMARLPLYPSERDAQDLLTTLTVLL